MKSQVTNADFQRLVQQVQDLKAKGEVDLSMEEDLSLAIMNLVNLEEHFYFTASKTGKDEYFDFLGQVREIRTALLRKMIDRHEGETWCITKHLLAATMRLIEVGTKLHANGKKVEAKEMFNRGWQVYSLFWGIRLKLVNLSGVKKIADGQLNIHDKGKTATPWTMSDIVNKLVDCCQE